MKQPDTLQELFDKTCEHLMKQRVRSSDGDICLYRGDDGCKCTAGIWISDEEYNDDMEGSSVSSLLLGSMFRDWDAKYVRLLQILQLLHDNYMPKYKGDTMRYIVAKLVETAKDFKLNVPECVAREIVK